MTAALCRLCLRNIREKNSVACAHKRQAKKKPAFACELFFKCGGERGAYSRRPWRSPSGSPEAVQNGCPAVLSNPVEGSHPLSAGSYMRKKSSHLHASSSLNVAVREGFEPSIRCRIHTFQACSFSHSDTSPYFSAAHLRWATGRYYRESGHFGQAYFQDYGAFA